MFATLPRPASERTRYGRPFYGHNVEGWTAASEQQRLAYVELMGHEPPAPRSNEMRVQYEYGHGKYRTKDMRAAILVAAEVRQPQLIAA
jgi:hypothetical protein